MTDASLMTVCCKRMYKNIIVIQKKLLNGFTGRAFAYGNTKIPLSTLIVNLTSAQNCPSQALGLCQVAHFCYAKKCERIYKNYLNKNLVMEQWLATASTKDIIRLMEAYIDASPVHITHIRLDEAGDFRNQNQLNQWNKIAHYFWNTRKIGTYTYTARQDLDFTGIDSIIVNASLPGIPGANREYRCLPANEYDNMVIEQGQYKCPGNCNLCSMCFTDRFTGTIYCRKH